jgi:hypothetical protein
MDHRTTEISAHQIHVVMGMYTNITSKSHFLSKATIHLVQYWGITDHTRTSYVCLASEMVSNQVG